MVPLALALIHGDCLVLILFFLPLLLVAEGAAVQLAPAPAPGIQADLVAVGRKMVRVAPEHQIKVTQVVMGLRHQINTWLAVAVVRVLLELLVLVVLVDQEARVFILI